VTILALDLGTKFVGVATSQGFIASALTVLAYNQKNPEQFILELKKIVDEQQVEKIVAGLPLDPNGGETKQSQWTREQVRMIEKELGILVEFYPEEFSSWEAQNTIDKKSKKILGRIDAEAARVILENYLNERSG
jgi:putative Holliday junction resolvase